MKAVPPGKSEFSPAEDSEQEKDVSGLSRIPLRVLLLALLILFVNSWFSAHLNVDLKTLLMIEAVPAVIAVIRKPLGRDDANTIDRTLRRSVEFLLGNSFLVAEG